MPRIRSEYHIRREPVTLFEDVVISTYDKVGKRGPDAKAVLSESDEGAEFLFITGGNEGDVATVAFFGGTGTTVQLKLSGTGSKGSHLAVGTNGVIVASNTDSAQPLTENEIGIALEGWTDGQATECELYKI